MNFKDIKSNARRSLDGHWGIAILASFIAGICGATGSSITYSTDEVDFSKFSELSSQELITTIAVFAGAILLGLIVSLVVTSLVSVGYAQFNINLIDGIKPRIITLFSKWKQVWTSVAANILVFVRVLFGCIFFIIPGIIAAYKYAMINYVIAENPGISAREALETSKNIMKGHKLRFFLFGLSFIGWILLTVLTLGIASIWTLPYMQASYAAFYKEIA